jgi:hypothetical protein
VSSPTPSQTDSPHPPATTDHFGTGRARSHGRLRVPRNRWTGNSLASREVEGDRLNFLICTATS